MRGGHFSLHLRWYKSTDATLDELRELAVAFGLEDGNEIGALKTHCLSSSLNFGKEAAIYAVLEKGIALGCGLFVVMDADLQDPPSLIPEMYRLICSLLIFAVEVVVAYAYGLYGVLSADGGLDKFSIERLGGKGFLMLLGLVCLLVLPLHGRRSTSHQIINELASGTP